MDQTECSLKSAYKIHTPKNYPEESIQHSEHGESLKSIKHKNTSYDFCCRFHVWLCRSCGGHSGGAPLLDPQVLQSQVAAQDYTGSTLSHNWNGKEQHALDINAQSSGMWRRVIWYIGTNASERNMLSPSSKTFPPWRRRQQSLSKQWHNLPMYSASCSSLWGDKSKSPPTFWKSPTFKFCTPWKLSHNIKAV
jgi:hypothetical protein